MKHAGQDALDQLESLLVQLREQPGMVEKKHGVFYRKSKAFLHFHEDPKGLFADIRTADGGDFERLDVSTAEGRAALVVLACERLRV